MAEEQNVLPKDTGTVRGKPKDAAAQTKIQPDEREMTSVPRSIAVHPATIGKHDVLSPIFHVGNLLKSVKLLAFGRGVRFCLEKTQLGAWTSPRPSLSWQAT